MRRLLVPVIVAVTVLAAVVPAMGAALCPAECRTIDGSPLRVVVAADTSLQIYVDGGTDGQVYPPSGERGNAGTFVGVDGMTFEPDTFTLVSQTPVTGTGTAADPRVVVTVVQVGPATLGIRLTETVRLVNGQPYFRIDRRISNTGAQARTVRVFHYADLYLQGSDRGYGYYDPVTGAIGGQNEAADFFQAFIPITPASAFMEGRYSEVRSAVRIAAGGGPSLPNTFKAPGDPANLLDNGAALQWNLNVPAGASRTVSDFWSFGVTPQIPPVSAPPSVAAIGPARVTPGGTLTITGSAFGSAPGTVSVGGVPARIVSWSATRIVVVVGAGTPAGVREVIVSRAGEVSDPFVVTVAALPPAPNLARTIPFPATISAGPARVTFPRRMSLRSLKRSKCVRVAVRSARPARVLVTIFSGNRSIRLFGQKRVVFRAKGRKVVCIRVPARAKTFDVRTPLRFAVGWKVGARPRAGEPSPKPKIRDIVLVP